MADPFNVSKDEEVKDTDSSWASPHHTIGGGPTQAAAGNHRHDGLYLSEADLIPGANITLDKPGDGTVKITAAGSGGGGGVTDHGALSGLNPDDDHPQYLNNSRGDARYSKISHTHTGYSLDSHTHSGYAASNHTHSPAQCGIRSGVHPIGTVPANSSAGPFTVPHGLGKTPTAVVANGSDDTGAQSIVISIQSWNATNVTFLARNLGSANESCSITWIAVG